MHIFLICVAVWVLSGWTAVGFLIYNEVSYQKNEVTRKDFVTMVLLGTFLAPLAISVMLDELGVFYKWQLWWERPLFKPKHKEEAE